MVVLLGGKREPKSKRVIWDKHVTVWVEPILGETKLKEKKQNRNIDLIQHG